MNDGLTHLDGQGVARMVDVGAKPQSERMALAAGTVRMQPATLQLIREGALKKGDVFAVARLAGIMAAKQTAALIPLCHPLALTHIDVELEVDVAASALRIQALARTTGPTGVEMEALTAVTVAALAVYDMAKAVDRGMRISEIHLLEKRGGQRGDYVAQERLDAD